MRAALVGVQRKVVAAAVRVLELGDAAVGLVGIRWFSTDFVLVLLRDKLAAHFNVFTHDKFQIRYLHGKNLKIPRNTQ